MAILGQNKNANLLSRVVATHQRQFFLELWSQKFLQFQEAWLPYLELPDEPRIKQTPLAQELQGIKSMEFWIEWQILYFDGSVRGSQLGFVFPFINWDWLNVCS